MSMREFSEACEHFYSGHRLREKLSQRLELEEDCAEWNLSRDQWQEAVRAALRRTGDALA